MLLYVPKETFVTYADMMEGESWKVEKLSWMKTKSCMMEAGSER
jgi:hypothetical protein